jgi:3-hydroxyacyl-CoA dehydrogenase
VVVVQRTSIACIRLISYRAECIARVFLDYCGKVSTSGYEAFDTGLLQHGKDIIVVNKDRQIAEAKKHALLMAEAGYTQPIRRTDVKVLGKQALGMFLVGTDQMELVNTSLSTIRKLLTNLAYVMAGGDLSEPTMVSEQYLLDLEREAFLSLCTERKH